MKKIITLSVAAMAVMGAFAQNEPITLDLNNPTNPTSINYGDDGVWTETYNDIDYTFFEFTPFAFSHLIGGEGSSWGGYYWDGFTISHNSGKSGWQANAAGGGMANSDATVGVDANEPYLIGYWPEFMESPDYHACEMTFDDGNNYRIQGAWVNMNAQALSDVTNGGGSARKFDIEGDSFKLIAHGVGADGNESTAEIELAGFNNGQLTSLTDWTYWDLSSLGRVESVYFTMTSTDVGTWGTNTSTYFCLSGVTVSKPMPTGIETIDSKAPVASVKYYNLAGVESDTPFEGLNIVVTTRTDGSRTAAKVVR